MALRVAVGGFGAIGKVVAAALDRGIDGLTLAAVSARDTARAEAAMAGFATPVPVLPLDRLWEEADIVVECAPAKYLRDVAEPALANGRTLITLTCGALLDNFDLVELAREHGGRILVPTGALIGLDAVQAAALGGGIRSVQMITRKPPGGLEGAPYLVEHSIDVSGLNTAKLVFTGNAREAARGFPGQRQCRGGAGAGRHRPRPHDDRDLGRPRGRPQHSPHRGRGRRRAVLDADRERAEPGKPAHRAADPAIGHRPVTEAGEPAGDRHLNRPHGYKPVTNDCKFYVSCCCRGSTRMALWSRKARKPSTLPAHRVEARGTYT